VNITCNYSCMVHDRQWGTFNLFTKLLSNVHFLQTPCVCFKRCLIYQGWIVRRLLVNCRGYFRRLPFEIRKGYLLNTLQNTHFIENNLFFLMNIDIMITYRTMSCGWHRWKKKGKFGSQNCTPQESEPVSAGQWNVQNTFFITRDTGQVCPAVTL
jgi:hypothetical protein